MKVLCFLLNLASCTSLVLVQYQSPTCRSLADKGSSKARRGIPKISVRVECGVGGDVEWPERKFMISGDDDEATGELRTARAVWTMAREVDVQGGFSSCRAIVIGCEGKDTPVSEEFQIPAGSEGRSFNVPFTSPDVHDRMEFLVADQAASEKRVVIVRHGVSEFNEKSKLSTVVGSVKGHMLRDADEMDHPLSADGLKDCKASQELVEAQDQALPVEFKFDENTLFLVSPLTRAIQTMRMMFNKWLKYNPVIAVANLRENGKGSDCLQVEQGKRVIDRVNTLTTEGILEYKLQETIEPMFVLEKRGFTTDDGIRAAARRIFTLDASPPPQAYEADVYQLNVNDAIGHWSGGGPPDFEVFFNYVKYSPHKTIVMVGHSLYWKEICDELKAANLWSVDVDPPKPKMSNAMALDLRFSKYSGSRGLLKDSVGFNYEVTGLFSMTPGKGQSNGDPYNAESNPANHWRWAPVLWDFAEIATEVDDDSSDSEELSEAANGKRRSEESSGELSEDSYGYVRQEVDSFGQPLHSLVKGI